IRAVRSAAIPRAMAGQCGGRSVELAAFHEFEDRLPAVGDAQGELAAVELGEPRGPGAWAQPVVHGGVLDGRRGPVTAELERQPRLDAPVQVRFAFDRRRALEAGNPVLDVAVTRQRVRNLVARSHGMWPPEGRTPLRAFRFLSRIRA